jgi:hypothetical protein
MKYQNKTGVTVYTYVGNKLVAVQPGGIVEVAGYKPPPQLTLIEEEMVNAIRRRQLARAAAIDAERAAKAAKSAPEVPAEVAPEVAPEVAKTPPKKASKKKATPSKPEA